jgi:hypothetical protein
MATLKTYSIRLGPVAMPVITEGYQAYQIVETSTLHTARGVTTKLLQADTTFFQIVDADNQVTFSAPAHMIIYCKVEDTPPLMTLVTPIAALPKRRRKKDDVDDNPR